MRRLAVSRGLPRPAGAGERRPVKGALDRYHYLHAARADLLRRLGEREAAAAAYATAARLAGSAPERAYLERRLVEVTGD